MFFFVFKVKFSCESFVRVRSKQVRGLITESQSFFSKTASKVVLKQTLEPNEQIRLIRLLPGISETANP